MSCAQVIFLNRWLDCPDYKLKEHFMIQNLITQRKIEYEYEIRDYSLYQKQLSKLRFHNLMRDRIRIITKNGVFCGQENQTEEVT